MKSNNFVLLVFVLMYQISCGPDPVKDTTTYEDMILEGWTSYSQNEFDMATAWFIKAKKKEPSFAEAYTGLAWIQMKLDSLIKAEEYFNTGALKINVTADHYAGWAFMKNAQKEFDGSNTYAQAALDVDSEWSFPYAVGLSASDLKLLQAQNYFLLGDYTNSLLAVKVLNPGFDADIFDSAGQGLLAKEIERLRKIV
ncbi:hypothetical protein JNL27_00530 [bacterium]|nr:hypothetical protein [bacterium]